MCALGKKSIWEVKNMLGEGGDTWLSAWKINKMLDIVGAFSEKDRLSGGRVLTEKCTRRPQVEPP